MTEIYVDRDGMEIRLKDVVARVDDSDAALADLPPAPDAGIVTSMIALVASAGAEAAGMANDATRALSAITTDVLDDMTLTDEKMAEELRAVERQLDER